MLQFLEELRAAIKLWQSGSWVEYRVFLFSSRANPTATYF